MMGLKKVLLTDLCGTLIRRNRSESKELYGSLEKEIAVISQYLNEFLSEGNELAIVTSPGSHDYFGNIVNQYLARLNDYIKKQFHSHIVYYLQGNGKLTPADRISKKITNGKTVYQGENSFYLLGVDQKEEAVDDFLQTIKPPYQLYALGDTEQDIPMLLKVQELGGISCLMDTTLYHRAVTTEEIINNELHLEFDFRLHNMIENNTLIEPESKTYTKEALSLLMEKERRKQELYTLLSAKELNLDELNKNYSKYIEWSNYRMLQENSTKTNNGFYEKYPFDENLVENVMRMSCYPSFGKYYSKVLKRK